MNGLPWKCPVCLGILEPGPTSWRCRSCERVSRALRGIPDLRTSEDIYLSNQADWEFAQKLDEAYDRLDFQGLLNLYFELSPEVSPRQRRSQIDHILSAPGRVRGWLDAIGPVEAGCLLDLGCGSGSFLAAIGADRMEVFGIDIAMRWLIIARKRLEEEGFGLIPLACACAERLPIAPRSLSNIIAGDVIEHVGDQRATLFEAFRVLRSGGRLFLASPNRFSIAPEPHVGVWGVGYLPRRWMPAYVRIVSRLDFRGIHTLGYSGWSSLLRSSPFRGGQITVPPLPESDFTHFGPVKRLAARLHNRLVALPPGQRVARIIGPLFHVVCERPVPRSHPADPS